MLGLFFYFLHGFIAGGHDQVLQHLDIARHFGEKRVSKQRVNGWTKHSDFPDPEPNYPTRVWRAHEVLAFVSRHHPELT